MVIFETQKYFYRFSKKIGSNENDAKLINE